MLNPAVGPDLTAQLMEIVRDPALRDELNQMLGDFCHQCRNRLNSLKLSIYLAKRQTQAAVTPAWLALESNYQLLETHLEKVQTLCRPLSLSPVSLCIGLLLNDRRANWTTIMASKGKTIEFHPDEQASRACFDVNQLGSALDSLVAWRAEQGGGSATTQIRWWADHARAYVSWSEPARVTSDTRCSGKREESAWILPILTRVVIEHGGTLELDDRDGWFLQITLPKTIS